MSLAVILAAGQGIRLRPLTDSVPKALIRIDDRPLIRYSLANLSRQGIHEALVVVGYKGELIREELGEACEGISITYVDNPNYSTSGSMCSLRAAEPHIRGGILLLESDLFYEQRAIEIAEESPYADLILVAKVRGSGDEVYIDADKRGRLIGLGKELARRKGAVGELVGISKLSYRFLKRMSTQSQIDISIDPKISYEEVIATTARHYSHSVYCVFVKGLRWTEVDTAHDLDVAVRLAGGTYCDDP